MGLFNRVKSWRPFNKKSTDSPPTVQNYTYVTSPYRRRLRYANERSLIASLINRIAIDVSSIDIKHCMTDEDGKYKATAFTTLHECLTKSANIDQTGRAFRLDVVMSMLDEGVVAVVPVETDVDIVDSGSYAIYQMRTGKIVKWLAKYVTVALYNEDTGTIQEVTLPKSKVAIVENPLYSIMNEPNSTLRRLSSKLALLDIADEDTASGKLDLIIQLPYVIKSEQRLKEAENRRRSIEQQLTTGKYGIAYIDGTEKITQLNRSVENDLMRQIEFLTNQLFGQIGITQSILDGTADEQTMLNYYNRTINPIVTAICEEFTRKFISQNSLTRGYAILPFRDPFSLTPLSQIAEIADKFTRNCILTSNEIRSGMGYKPSEDPKSDQLINSNLNHDESEPDEYQVEEENQNG